MLALKNITFTLEGRRLFDDASALNWMAPQGAPGVEVLPWRDPQDDEVPGDVVVEAFACKLPEGYLQAMKAREKPALWINLEYLSAEDWVSGCHGSISTGSVSRIAFVASSRYSLRMISSVTNRSNQSADAT